MSYDPNDLFDFDEPDWLSELMEKSTPPKAETPRSDTPSGNTASDGWLYDMPTAEAPKAHAPEDDRWYDVPEEKPKTRPHAESPKRSAASGRRTPGKGTSSPKASASGTSAGRPAGDWEKAREKKSASASRPGKNRRKKTNLPMFILILVLTIGMVFAAWQLANIFLGYSRDRSAYNDLASAALSEMAEQEESSRQPDGPATAPQATTEPVESEIPFTVDWDYLRSINSDIVGWLYCPDTVINYPVVQSQNHDYYLNHGFDKSSNTTGTLFADRSSVAGINQSNLIIYGHNMKDESMFGTYKHYVDESYYNEHPILYYLTPSGSYRVELVCAHIAEATAENFPTYFSSTTAQQEYLNLITSSAFWVNYDAVTTDYQLMTMSTCTSSSRHNDPRFLVHGIMIPIQ